MAAAAGGRVSMRRQSLAPTWLRAPLLVAATVIAVTSLAGIASALVPELAPADGPHPTLRGTMGEAISIMLINGRSLIVPFLLCAGRWHTGRLSRHVGDAIVAALVITNAVAIGLALGRYPTQLPAYLPHLPLEDTALALAASAWLTRRHPNGQQPIHLAILASLTFAIALLAAIVETYAVPHAS